MQYNCREFTQSDKNSILEELKRISNIGPEQWNWKFFENPELASKIWVIDDNEKLAGHMALQGNKLIIDKQIISRCQAVDLFIKENYRRKGLFVKLGQTSLDYVGQHGMSIAYGFPNHEALGGHLKYGWRNIGMIPRAFKPLNIGKYVESLEKHPPMLESILKMKSRETPVPTNSLEITQIDEFLSTVDEFSKEALQGKNAVFRT
ncbi:MAG: GNAT family N-acetyltransferase, partial [Candidatus Heimdallarchaeota archaeon]|nr:GNAT family N-acetyltransferase [Candidatus Heimdallarchaeota archaeon]